MRWGWGWARGWAVVLLLGLAAPADAARIFGSWWRNTTTSTSTSSTSTTTSTSTTSTSTSSTTSTTLQALYQEGVSTAFNVDTQLRQDQATTNFGTTTTLTVGVTNGATKVFHSIFDVDLSALAGKTVMACTLTLNLDAASAAPTASHMFRLCTEHWNDTLSEATSTWNIWLTASNWGTAGAISTTACASGGDIDNSLSIAMTTLPTGNEANNTAFTFDDITSLCQDAITNRSGILRILWKQDSEAVQDNNIQFTSSDGGTAAQRPKLTVNYR